MKYPNLNTEQARNNMTNAQTAAAIGINRITYQGKKKSGRFYASECQKLCKLFNCSFDYLFKTDDGEKAV